MSDRDQEKDERIALLEQQVAELRDRLDRQEPAAEDASSAESPGESPEEQAFFDSDSEPEEPEEPEIEDGPAEPEDARALEAHMPSKKRAIVIAVVLGIVAFVAISAIVISLSRVIDPLSKSAAGAISPFEAPEQTEKPPPKAAPDPLRAPGL